MRHWRQVQPCATRHNLARSAPDHSRLHHFSGDRFGRWISISNPPAVQHSEAGVSPGTFNSAFMEMITDLWSRIKPARSKRIRLQLNFVQLSACILAVRIGKDYERLRLKRKISIERRRAMKRVVSALERELKRARRAYAADMGEDAYKKMRAAWLEHLRWIRMQLVYFRPWRVRRSSGGSTK